MRWGADTEGAREEYERRMMDVTMKKESTRDLRACFLRKVDKPKSSANLPFEIVLTKKMYFFPT